MPIMHWSDAPVSCHRWGVIRRVAHRRLLRHLLRGCLAAVALLAVALAVLLRAGCWSLATQRRPNPEPSASSWQTVLAGEPFVTVTPIVTGHATGDRRMVLDPEDPNVEQIRDRYAPSPVIAYHVRHPQRGDFLIDAGLSRSFAAGGSNYSAALRGLLAAMGSSVVQPAGGDAAAWLRARGITPAAVFLTHLHGDHTSGLAELPCSVPAVFGLGDDTFTQKALMGDHLNCRPVQVLDFHAARAMPPFDAAIDLFGDGLLWALATPGHSAGHVSYLARTGSGPMLITGDAAAYHEQLAHRIRPTPGVYDQAAAIRSLGALAAFTRQFPRAIVAPGHDTPRANDAD
jgi:glyoxylase-like metal-dependent hydrolase (beta-lactamase superfamily II)